MSGHISISRVVDRNRTVRQEVYKLQVVLFRPHQRRRQAWVERLRRSGYDIKFVHDPERISGETDLVVIDTAVERWKEYVRLVQGQGKPIVLLTDSNTQLTEDEFESLGVAETVTQKEETDRVFAKFLCPKASGPTDRTKAQTQAAFPQYGRGLILTFEEPGAQESEQADSIQDEDKESGLTVAESEIEQAILRDMATGSTLSQRKAARQRSAERRSTKTIPAISEDHAFASDEVLMRDIKPPLTEDEEQDPPNSPAKGQTWPEDPVVQVADQTPFLPSARSRELPSLAAVYSAKGGVGKTTFLLHLAAILAKEGRRVCVLDLDLMHGTVASMLQIQPNKTIIDLVRRIDDPKAGRACLLPTKTGFSIVAAPLRPCTFRMKHEQLLAVLRFLKEETDIVLIDTPVHFDSLIKLALEQAEQLFLMTTDEPASIRSLVRMKPLLSSLQPTPELYMVWNRLTEQAPMEQWRENLPWPVMLELPEDPTVGKAVRSDQWIASSPCSPYRLRVKQLADRWLGVEPKRSGDKQNLLRRLLSNRNYMKTT